MNEALRFYVKTVVLKNGSKVYKLGVKQGEKKFNSSDIIAEPRLLSVLVDFFSIRDPGTLMNILDQVINDLQEAIGNAEILNERLYRQTT